MLELQALLATAPADSPYTKPVKVTVVKRGVSATSDRPQLAVCDKSACVKLLCHSKEQADSMVEGKTYIIRNFTLGHRGVLLMNKSSQVSKCGNVQIPTEMETAAKALISPTTPPSSPIKDILSRRQIGALVSVEGTIENDELPRTVNVGSTRTSTVRNLTVADGRSCIKVALWKNISESPVKVGSHVKLTHMAVKADSFNNSVALGSTSNTRVELVEQPIRSIDVTFLGISKKLQSSYIMLVTIEDECAEMQCRNSVITKIYNTCVEDELLEKIEEMPTHHLLVQGEEILGLAEEPQEESTTL